MDIIKTTLTIAAIGSLTLTAVHAAGSAHGHGVTGKHSSTTHATSGRGPKAAAKASGKSSRNHTSSRTSRATPARTLARANDRVGEANRRGQSSPGDLNDRAELPRHENESESEQDDNDGTGTLLGAGADGDGRD